MKVLILLLLLWAQSDSTTSISENTPLTLRLDDAAPVELVYEAQSDEVITLTVRALDELDPVVEILMSERDRLAYNDDYGGEMDAAIVGLRLSAGRYTVRVWSFNGVSEGEVEVTLQTVEQYTIEVSDEGITVIVVELANDDLFQYELQLTADQTYTLTARDPSSRLDPVLIVRDAAGEIAAQNDDHASDDLMLNIFDARIGEFTPSADSMYTLELREFAGRGGNIEITVSAR